MIAQYIEVKRGDSSWKILKATKVFRSDPKRPLPTGILEAYMEPWAPKHLANGVSDGVGKYP